MNPNDTKQQLLEGVGEGIGYVKAYVEQHVQLAQLKFVEKGAKIGSSLISGLFISLLSAFVVGFGSIALGFYLGERLDSNALGFLMVTGIFALLLISLILFKKSFITNPLITTLIHLLRD